MNAIDRAIQGEIRRRLVQQNALVSVGFGLYVFWWLGNTVVLALSLALGPRIGMAIGVAMVLMSGAMRAAVSPYQLLALASYWLLVLPEGWWVLLVALLWLAQDEADGWGFLSLGAACALGETYLVEQVVSNAGVAASRLALLGAVSAVWLAVVASRFHYRALGLAAAAYLLPGIPGLHEVALTLTVIGSVARLFLRPVNPSGGADTPGGPSPHNSASRFARPDEIPGMRR